jgi:hypothetical protein
LNDFDQDSNITSKLVVMSLQNQDGTILILKDDTWPPFRISLVDMASYWKFPGSAQDIAIGTVITIHPSMVDTIPVISSPTQWPAGSGRPSRNGFEYVNELKRKVSLGRFTDLTSEASDQPGGPADSTSKLNQPNLLKKESSNGFPQGDLGEASDLRAEQIPLPGSYVTPPRLLDLSFVGYQNIRIGDTLSWKFSIRQGDSPMASLQLNFRGNYNSVFTASQSFAVPVGFDGSNTVTNGTLSFQIRSLNQYLPGTYTFESLILTTQPCPVNMSVSFNSYGSISYSSPLPAL